MLPSVMLTSTVKLVGGIPGGGDAARAAGVLESAGVGGAADPGIGRLAAGSDGGEGGEAGGVADDLVALRAVGVDPVAFGGRVLLEEGGRRSGRCGDTDRRGRGGGGKVGGVRRSERHRELLIVADRQDRAGGRGVGERAGDAAGDAGNRPGRRRVELGARQGRARDDAGGVGPGDRRRGLGDVDQCCRGGGRVIGGVGGREGDRQGLVVARLEDCTDGGE